jgi:hypothetical protein
MILIKKINFKIKIKIIKNKELLGIKSQAHMPSLF